MSDAETKSAASEFDLDASALPSDVSCLLIPLSTGKLVLLPNSTVAEVLPVLSFHEEEEGPEWRIGNLDWRGLSIPLVSLELINGEAWNQTEAVTRMAVFNGCLDSEALPFYGVVTQGIPRLLRVSSQGVTVREGEPLAAEDMLVLVNGEPAVIPNLAAIEQLLLKK